MKLFFDGGCRPAPIGMEIAVVAGGVTHFRRDLGPGSSMDAEWLALIEAMRHVHRLELSEALLLGDAAAVIAQANGTVRTPPAYRHHLDSFQQLLPPPGRLRIRHVKRTQNLAGIALAKLPPR